MNCHIAHFSLEMLVVLKAKHQINMFVWRWMFLVFFKTHKQCIFFLFSNICSLLIHMILKILIHKCRFIFFIFLRFFKFKIFSILDGSVYVLQNYVYTFLIGAIKR